MRHRPVELSAFLVCAILLFPSLTAFDSDAASTWTDAGAGMQAGTMNGTELANGLVRLKSDPAGFDWNLTNDGILVGRAFYAFAYDSARDLAVLFSGSPSEGNNARDTWVYDYASDNWTQIYPVNRPEVRYNAAMAYDTQNGACVLFGGNQNWDPNKYRSEVYTLNISNNAWTLMNPATKPPPRSYHAMVYDEREGVFVVFGGYDEKRRYNDTWTYNLTTNTWVNKTTQKAPSARQQPSMVYDTKAGVTVLFGGYDLYGKYCNDTWVYYISNNTWVEMKPSMSPPGRYDTAMAYDASVDRCVIFGGHNETDPYTRNDTWAYDLSANSWTDITPAGSPSIRYGHRMVYNSRHDVLVCFGGYYIIGEEKRDTWVLDTSAGSWRLMDPYRVPDDKGSLGMGYDPVAGLFILHTGAADTGGSSSLKDETWSYNTTSGKWTLLKVGAIPATKYQIGMVFDERAGLFVLIGGREWSCFLENVWTFSASNGTWCELQSLDPLTCPLVRTGAAFCYDSRRGTILMFGGYSSQDGYLNDTWSYNLTTNLWTKHHPAGAPPGGDDYAMGYDVLNDVFVLFSYDSSRRTWTFSPATRAWTEKYPAVKPPLLDVRYMAYDRSSGLLNIVAGDGANETWGYDVQANRWIKSGTVPLKFSHRDNVFLAYDSNVGAMIVVAWFGEGVTWTGVRHFTGKGDFTSAPKDTGGSAYYGNITWSGLGGHRSAIRFQLRTGSGMPELMAAEFAGPDGTDASYYDRCGQRINGVHNGSRWVQYRASLSSEVNTSTPVLKNVSIGYNLIHSLRIISPAGGENWTGAHDISWEVNDPDVDGARVDICLINGSSSTTLAANVDAFGSKWSWNTTLVPNGTYAIRLVARDNNAEIPLVVNATSGDIVIFHPPPPDRPPSVTLSGPGEGELIDNETVVLSWSGSDPDGDELSYFVLLSTDPFSSNNPPSPIAHTTLSSHALAGLADNESYYWTVIPNDSILNGSMPAPRKFTVKLPPPVVPPPNQLPVVELLAPPDAATLNTTAVTLSWRGFDADGDVLAYYVVFSDAPVYQESPFKSITRTTNRSLSFSELANGTVYYWTVTPNDGKENGMAAKARKFIVDVTFGNNPPTITSRAELSASAGALLVFCVTAMDPDGDALTFSLADPLDGMAIDPASGEFTWTPDAARTGMTKVTVRATDSRGASCEQTLSIFVKGIPMKPTCTIDHPSNGQVVNKKTTIGGTAAGGSAALASVQVRLDGGNWMRAAGTGNWTFELDPSELAVGAHLIEARSWDGSLYSDTASVRITVERPAGGGTAQAPLPLWLVVSVAVASATGLAAGLLVRNRAKK